MTNHWIDIKNSDVIMVIGSNAAENHPISFKWVQDAINKGAKLIVVDPRFTRTASKAHIYCQIRSGTDIAFMNGMIRYALKNGRINWDYIKSCTNAPFLLDPNFKTCRTANPHPDLGSVTGIFSGLEVDPCARHKVYKYNKGSTGTNPGYWSYQYDGTCTSGDKDVKLDTSDWWSGSYTTPPWGSPPSGPDPDSVLRNLWQHVNIYTPAKVSKICGTPQSCLNDVYDAYTSTYQDQLSACIMYAMGSTQHTYGSQNVRSYAMIQLLLGNTGVAGGGINALRGESNVQGSTDMCLLWHILPGYLTVCKNTAAFKNRAAYKNYYATQHTPIDPVCGYAAGNPRSLAWWRNGPRYLDSLLQAWWPIENAPNSLDTAYNYLPKAEDCKWYTHE